MTFKDKLIVYFYNKGNRIENDFKERQQYIRYHHVDEVDYLDIIIEKVRQDTFNEIFKDVMLLIKGTEKN